MKHSSNDEEQVQTTPTTNNKFAGNLPQKWATSALRAWLTDVSLPDRQQAVFLDVKVPPAGKEAGYLAGEAPAGVWVGLCAAHLGEVTWLMIDSPENARSGSGNIHSSHRAGAHHSTKTGRPSLGHDC